MQMNICKQEKIECFLEKERDEVKIDLIELLHSDQFFLLLLWLVI